jgi:predicted metal-binding protein
MDQQQLEGMFQAHGFDDFRWLTPGDIAVAEWVRMKCAYGCEEYGKNVACPPNNPAVEACERFIREYTGSAIFRFHLAARDREERKTLSRDIDGRLLELERAVFLSGYHKAFMMLMGGCPLCEICAGRPEDCLHPGSARPTPEGFAVDLFATARSVGYPLEVLTDYAQPMNRYAILLVE